jgi:hypothetical protein
LRVTTRSENITSSPLFSSFLLCVCYLCAQLANGFDMDEKIRFSRKHVRTTKRESKRFFLEDLLCVSLMSTPESIEKDRNPSNLTANLFSFFLLPPL